MKKLSIGLILLGLFAFLPQFTNADVILPPRGVEIIGVARELSIPFFIALIITSVLKGLCSIPFGKRFSCLVLITNLITTLLLFSSFWYCTNWGPCGGKELQSLIISVLIVVALELGVFLIFVKDKPRKLLKLFLFALLSNILAYSLGSYLFIQIMIKYHF